MRAGSRTLTHPIRDKIFMNWVAIKILDHSPELLGVQNAANLSRGVPTPKSQLFQSPKISKKTMEMLIFWKKCRRRPPRAIDRGLDPSHHAQDASGMPRMPLGCLPDSKIPPKSKNIKVQGLSKNSFIFPLFPLRGPLGALSPCSPSVGRCPWDGVRGTVSPSARTHLH